MAQKKYNPEDIDEDFLISTIQNEKQAVAQKSERKSLNREGKAITLSIMGLGSEAERYG